MENLETDSKFLKKAMIVNVVGTILKVCGPLLTFVMARIFGAAEFGIFVSAQTLLLTIAHSERSDSIRVFIGICRRTS